MVQLKWEFREYLKTEEKEFKGANMEKNKIITLEGHYISKETERRVVGRSEGIQAHWINRFGG